MLSQEIIIKRLALIKLLYNNGLEQSKQPEPMNSFSVLSFHDSIEMFLKLLTQHLEIKSEKFDFVEYWNNIPTLTLKESCRHLNEIRKTVKHRGLLASKSDVEMVRVTTTEFFNQNSITQFALDFKDISLTMLIANSKVRELLSKSQLELDQMRYMKSIDNVAEAFYELIESYENSKNDFGSPFNLGNIKSIPYGISVNSQDDNLKKFVDIVKDSIEHLQMMTKITGLGIDYRKFVKFKMLTPIVTRVEGGPLFMEISEMVKWDQGSCQFCINFVIESAIKLQEFDFEVAELMKPEAYIIEIKE